MFLLLLSLLLYISSVKCFSRVQNHELIKLNSDGTTISTITYKQASKSVKVQAAVGSSCQTGCPGGCDVSAGNSGIVMSAPVKLYHLYIGHTASDYAPAEISYSS